MPAILQVSSRKHNAKKSTTRTRGLFHQLITAILTEEKKREAASSSLPNQHMLQPTCFGTEIETGADSKDDRWVPGPVQRAKKRSKRENGADCRTL